MVLSNALFWNSLIITRSKISIEQKNGDLGYHDYQTSKWVELDGDIDAVWIESMNIVMDDDNVLTLLSNVRISLSPAMGMVFVINSLKSWQQRQYPELRYFI